MTLAELEAMDSNTLTVKQVADFLGKDPQIIRDQAEREPKYLGFPICKAGHSYCIPKLGFVAWVKGQTPMYVFERTDQINEIEIRDGSTKKEYMHVYDMDIIQFRNWAENKNIEIATNGQRTEAYVYFISDGEYIKIGVAKDINKRIHELQIAQPRRLKVLMAIPFCNVESAYLAEDLFHNEFAKYAIRGEWFKALEIVSNCNLRKIFRTK